MLREKHVFAVRRGKKRTSNTAIIDVRMGQAHGKDSGSDFSTLHKPANPNRISQVATGLHPTSQQPVRPELDPTPRSPPAPAPVTPAPARAPAPSCPRLPPAAERSGPGRPLQVGPAVPSGGRDPALSAQHWPPTPRPTPGRPRLVIRARRVPPPAPLAPSSGADPASPHHCPGLGSPCCS
jgi:hypothetical protein